jgi:hypothetical protein
MSTPDKSTKLRTRRDENWITVPGLFSIPSSRQKKNPETSLYVIGMVGQYDHVKIGVAVNVAYRIIELQTACPFRLELLAARVFKSKREAIRVERLLHRQFSAVRASGEWFRLDAASRESLISSLVAA